MSHPSFRGRRRAALVLFLSSAALLLAASFARAATARPPIDGLDSLASATLYRALDYLEIKPEELGFDKLYAEDDTFRLKVVEDILNHPLHLPGWQKATVGKVRDAVGDPAALAALLGSICEAPDPSAPAAPAAPAPGAWRRLADSVRGRPGLAVTQASPAPAVQRFVSACREAESSMNQAFARLSDTDRQTILTLAPAFWGDQDDPHSPDRGRKGAIQFEVGASADTTIKLSEKKILDAAARLDRPALTRASRQFLAALMDLSESLARDGVPEATQTMEGVTGPIAASFDTPWGLLVIGGTGPNDYSAQALARIAFLFEPGGDDVYRGRAASAVGGGLIRPFGAIVDYAGDDLYDAQGRTFCLGGAVLGAAALLDLQGRDIYRGDDGSLGAGFFGTGFLYDGGGVDYFEGRNFCEGAGAFGLGALVSDASPVPPPGPEPERDLAYEQHLVPVPGTKAVPVRYDENDTYQAARQSQGFASTFGTGLLYDKAGNDVYRAGGYYLHRPLRPNDFQSLSQGFSIGFRPRAAGGVGILMDEEGNDFYDAEIYAQGASYWYSIGLLYDRAGNDRYHATQYAQGAGVHLSIGSIWDQGGDDQYVSQLGVTQGTAHDLSVGMQIDESGDDYYLVSDGQGISITNSVGIFIDGQGRDVYATPGVGQGAVTWTRGFCGAAIFLDLEGKDQYPDNSSGKNGAVWMHDVNAIGIDLDRTVQLPDEVLPPIVLTRADSSRTVEDLFKDASMWNVGSAREKVARARKALPTKGIAAVDYVAREKLASDDGLEYEAILDLAHAYPDSFAARIMPHLFDERVQAQRNVIALLGDLKRTEAVKPLEQMLASSKQEQHWTRVIQALGRLGDGAAAPRIRPFLADKLERRRLVAVVALAALKDSVSIGALAGMLEDPLLTVRSAACQGLRSFGAAAAGPVAQRLAGSPPDRLIVDQTLGRIADDLKDKTDPASLQAREAARRALAAELDRASPADAGPRAAAAEALLKLGEPEMRELVRVKMLDEYDPLVKRTVEKARGAE